MSQFGIVIELTHVYWEIQAMNENISPTWDSAMMTYICAPACYHTSATQHVRQASCRIRARCKREPSRLLRVHVFNLKSSTCWLPGHKIRVAKTSV